MSATPAPGASAPLLRGAGKLLDYRGAVALVIANTIGAGVFTTSGFALADLGEPTYVLLCWLAGGLYALSGVAIYADLAATFPESGGEYAFLRRMARPMLATIAGWISLVAGFTAPISAAALGAQLYLSRVVDGVPESPWVASAIVVVLALLHAGAPRQGVALQNLAVAIKVAAILFFIGLGASNAVGRVSASAPHGRFSVLAFGGALVWISYAYSGWNAAVYVTGEVAGGGVVVKRALFAGTLLVMALYFGVSAVILFGAPAEALRGVAESGAVAARAFGGPAAERGLSALIALALVTSVSSMLVSGPRVFARMAQDDVLPAALGRLHGDHPRIAILAQGAACLLVLWLAGLREVLEFVGVTLSLSSGAVVLGWVGRELRAKRRLRLVESAAALVFLATTAGLAIAALVMRPASALAAFALIAWGAAAHAARATTTDSP